MPSRAPFESPPTPRDAAAARPRVRVVVPALDEAAAIAAALEPVLAAGAGVECVVVDGGSTDGTRDVARAAGAIVIEAPRGRASQMNAGAAHAIGSRPAQPSDGGPDVMLFLHADTRLPEGWRDAVERALAQGAAWGRFDVVLDDPSPVLALVSAMMNLRSRITGICTGDQAIFVGARAWADCGGYAAIPLMEDVELSRRLKRIAGAPACVRPRVRVSARRWRRHGVLRTIVLMWWLRLRYALGDSPQRLHAAYHGAATRCAPR